MSKSLSRAEARNSSDAMYRRFLTWITNNKPKDGRMIVQQAGVLRSDVDYLSYQGRDEDYKKAHSLLQEFCEFHSKSFTPITKRD